MINVVSTFYISKYNSKLDSERSEELDTALLNNLNSPLIKKIHLFVDDNESLERLHTLTNNSDKIVIISVGKKPKYTDFFKYILEHLNNDICMIINADIYLLECEERLLDQIKHEKCCYALTRYEHNMSTWLMDGYGGSHDAYIFNSSYLNETILNEHVDFYQNTLGIESHLIKNFCDHGYRVVNPCKQIKIVHLHKTELRNHINWVGLHNWGDYDYHRKSCWWVPPVNI